MARLVLFMLVFCVTSRISGQIDTLFLNDLHLETPTFTEFEPPIWPTPPSPPSYITEVIYYTYDSLKWMHGYVVINLKDPWRPDFYDFLGNEIEGNFKRLIFADDFEQQTGIKLYYPKKRLD